MPSVNGNNLLKKQNGFSAIEVLIAVAIFALSGLALSELMGMFNKDMMTMEQKEELTELELKVKDIFSKSGECKELFRPFSGFQTGNQVLIETYIYIGAKDEVGEFYADLNRTQLVAKKGEKLPGTRTGLTVKEIRFENYSLINTEVHGSETIENYLADFVIEFEPGPDNRIIPSIDIPVILNTEGKMIQSCYDRTSRPVEVFSYDTSAASEAPFTLGCPNNTELVSYQAYCSHKGVGAFQNNMCRILPGNEDLVYAPKMRRTSSDTIEIACPGAAVSNLKDVCVQITCRYK